MRKLENNTDRTDIGICDECGSIFLRSASKMEGMCLECASIMYGYEKCQHIFKDGSRSEYIRSMVKQEFS